MWESADAAATARTEMEWKSRLKFTDVARDSNNYIAPTPLRAPRENIRKSHFYGTDPIHVSVKKRFPRVRAVVFCIRGENHVSPTRSG
jgi:hypothetical protein